MQDIFEILGLFILTTIIGFASLTIKRAILGLDKLQKSDFLLMIIAEVVVFGYIYINNSYSYK